ncbi:MAG: tetratricopeptide repeat protein [Bacteroidales bacterium]|nr:tetratricopeptide repeat protein [Bacteroidales bacterium]
MLTKKILFTIVCIIGLLQPVVAQQTAYYFDQDEDLKEGLELFAKEKYGAAQERFVRYLDRTSGQEVTARSDAQFFDAICDLRLEHSNAESKIKTFLEAYPESAKANQAAFEMGNYLFQKKRYRRALRWYQKMNAKKLRADEYNERAFKSGYCYFNNKEYDRAVGYFQELKDQTGAYTADSKYYFAYIQYLKGNYENSLADFLDLKDRKEYKGVVPYYITQIYYLQEKYEEVIGFAPGLLRQANEDQRTEIARIIGDAYFRLKDYSDAIPYLEQYKIGVKKINRQEHYQLGYAYYMNKQLNKAVAELERVKDGDDALSQNSNHLLGGILISLDDKYKARNAFRKASLLEFDKTIQEESLLNYAKLTFDLSISGETLRAFEEFLNTFPDSESLDDVYDYLVKVFMNTRNYKEALVTLDKISDKNADVKAAYQRIAYYRGLELFNNLKFRDAIVHFEKSLEYSWLNPTIKALCYYWTGEAWYRLKGYSKAIEYYNRFLLTKSAYDLPEYNLVHYNMGYAYFKKQDYNQALSWFRKYIGRVDRKENKLMADTYNRIGDCYFINRTYWQAIEYYDKASSLRTDDSDYAQFQKGFTLGLVQRPNRMIEELDRLITDFPKSNYADDAFFELAKSRLNLGERDKAIEGFKNLIRKFPNSSYVRRSYVQLGLIYYNSEQNTQALDMFKKIVVSWPDTPEAKDALAGIKNIFVDQNRVEDYFAYVKSISKGTDISLFEQDSLSYMAAENVFMQDDCDRARQYFKRYIGRFPNGQFLLNAHYYLADCEYRAAEYSKALTSYEWIQSKGVNIFSELALTRIGAIYYHQQNYSRALDSYKKLTVTAEVPSNILDARLGLLRCQYKLKDYPAVIKAANEVLYTDKIPDEIVREATFMLGKAYLETGDVDGALDVLSVVSQDVKNIEGAEAKYQRAQILFNKGMTDEAEKEVLDFLDKNTSHQYWLARAYVLWSDIYLKKDDLFQAKATLQILDENYENNSDGIKQMVRERIQKIDDLEK